MPRPLPFTRRGLYICLAEEATGKVHGEMRVNGMADTPAVPTLDLPYDPSSPRMARRWAEGTLSGVVSDDVIYDIILCVSELVANSIEHTAPTNDRKDITCKIRVRQLTSITLIHVECIDPGSEKHAPASRPIANTDEHGRGLQIVEGFADEWGYDDTVPGQRTTWFIVVVDRPANYEK